MTTENSSPNARDYCIAATELIRDGDKIVHYVRDATISRKIRALFVTESQKRRLLSINREAIEKAKEGFPYSHHEAEKGGADREYPYLIKYRELAYLFILEGR